MLHLDLGTLASRTLVFGGAYSNLQATQKIKKIAQDMRVDANHVICTGDIIAYCADASETLDLIQDWGIQVVKGNCEASLAEEQEDCGCGFEEGSACAVLSNDWFSYARKRVNRFHRDWMNRLPTRIEFTMNNTRFHCVHGSVSSMNEFIFKSTPQNKKISEFAALQSIRPSLGHHSDEVDVIIGGHSGIPFGQTLHHTSWQQDKYWLNAGVIGMPANDGSSHVWYMMLTPHHDHILVEWHTMDYDHVTAQQQMSKRGLPSAYENALKSGLWPSLDVLPPTEKAQTGLPLNVPELQIPTSLR